MFASRLSQMTDCRPEATQALVCGALTDLAALEDRQDTIEFFIQERDSQSASQALSRRCTHHS
jgi:hypothetical protein